MFEKRCSPKCGCGVMLLVLILTQPAGLAISQERMQSKIPAPAQLTPAPSVKSPSENAAAARITNSAAPQAQPALTLPDTTQMTLLIQQHMSALGQAIKTGNFTVLRDLGTKKFQEQNSVAALREKFAPFMEKHIDLTPIILFPPILVAAPSILEGRLIRLEGYYSTEPKRVHFDLLFEQVAGSWQLFGISARTSST